MRALSAVLFLTLALQGCVSMPKRAPGADTLTAEQRLQLGRAYEAEGLKADARKQYGLAAGKKRDNVPALMAQGNLAFSGGDLKSAEKAFRRALKLEPAHPGANNNLAMVYLARDQTDAAEKRLKLALQDMGPLRPYVLDTLASLRLRQGRTAEAAAALDEAQALAPPGPLRDKLTEARNRLPAY
jgi:Tfp pilus assembly protein PilF